MAFADKYHRAHESIVHNLRSQGWSREDAIYEADEKVARWMEQDEAARKAPAQSGKGE